MCHLPPSQQDTMFWNVLCAGAERRAKRIWFVAECLFKPEDNLRNKENRRGKRDHEDLFSLHLYISVSLNIRQGDFETLIISYLMVI